MTWLVRPRIGGKPLDVVPVRTNDESCVVVRYFCLHRGSLPENTAGVQPRFRGTIPCPKTFRKKLYVTRNRHGNFEGKARPNATLTSKEQIERVVSGV